MNKQPKSTIESMPLYIIILLIFQFILFSPELISSIKNKRRLSELFIDIFTEKEDHLYLYGFGILIVIFVIVHIIYIIWRKTVMKCGVKHSGKIIETVSSFAQISRRSTLRYKYKVKLENDSVVFTQNYLDNEIERQNLRTCTVYEYKGKYVFCDFK